TSTVKAIVTIESKHNLLTAGSEPAEVLAGNDIGTAEVKLATALPLADFREHGRAGGFLIIDPQTGSTVAAGIHTPEDAHTPEGEQS
ncbi:MAG: sulfate adenylyltransferase, partial [Brevibacterium aurantiacum]|nr:sulfate adenylyltransferase [Brevibacterium aurantiacum]